MAKRPTEAEIDALDAFSQRWLVRDHLENGREMEAVLALCYPPEIFAEYDRKIFGAFVFGYVMAKAT